MIYFVAYITLYLSSASSSFSCSKPLVSVYASMFVCVCVSMLCALRGSQQWIYVDRFSCMIQFYQKIYAAFVYPISSLNIFCEHPILVRVSVLLLRYSSSLMNKVENGKADIVHIVLRVFLFVYCCSGLKSVNREF